MRWRVNSKEYGFPLSKKGYLRGYIKYGIFAYASWHYLNAAFAPSHHGHGHGEHGHGDHGAAHGHSAHAVTHDHHGAKDHDEKKAEHH